MAINVPRETEEPTTALPPSPNPATNVDYARDIQPLLERSCYGCHGGEKHRGRLSLATRESLLQGGQSGDPAVVPGNGAGSVLIAMVSDQIEDAEMPPLDKREKHPPLTAGEIARLRAWIDAGLPWAEPATAFAPPTEAGAQQH